MAVLRQIRHGVLAFISGFLIVVLLGPTQTNQTLWNVHNPSDESKPFALISPSSTVDPLARESRVSDAKAGKIRWRIEMTEHYAWKEAQRIGLSPQALSRTADKLSPAVVDIARDPSVQGNARESNDGKFISADRPKSLDNRTSQSEPGSASNQVTGKVASKVAVTQLASYRNKPSPIDHDLRAYEYWSEQNVVASAIGQRLQQMNDKSLQAKAVQQLPGQPTRATLAWASLVGVLFVSIVVPFTWAASQRIDPPEQAEINILEVPKDWFYKCPSMSQRIAKVMRNGCLVVIVGTTILLLTRTYKHYSSTRPEGYSYAERLIARPLAEVADLI